MVFFVGYFTGQIYVLDTQTIFCFIALMKTIIDEIRSESICISFDSKLNRCKQLNESIDAFNSDWHFPSSQKICGVKICELLTTNRESSGNMFRFGLLKSLPANYNVFTSRKLNDDWWRLVTIDDDSSGYFHDFSNQFHHPKVFPRYASNAPKTKSKIVWIDMEMTGLDVKNDRIMEIACIITDKYLNIVAEHPSIVVNQPNSLLDSMNEWCITTHTQVVMVAFKNMHRLSFHKSKPNKSAQFHCPQSNRRAS